MRLLVLGASTRALAESAARAGYAPLAIDYFGDRDQGAVCECLALGRDLELARTARGLWRASLKVPHDAVTYAGGLENHPAVVHRLGGAARLLGNTPETLRRARDWRGLAARLTGAGFRVPRTLPAGVPGPATGRWLVKPRHGGGGWGVRPAVPGEVAGPGFYTQEFVEGMPASALFVAAGGDARLLGVTEQLVGRAEFGGTGFRYCGNILFPVVSQTLARRLGCLVRWLAAECGLVGLGGVDFLLRDGEAGEVVPVEVNPRYTAAMELVEQASGTNLFSMHLQSWGGRLPAPLPTWRRFWGKAVVYATEPGVWTFAGDWRAVGLRDVPHAGEALHPGQPVCTVLGAGETREACYRRLVESADRVRREWIAPPAAGNRAGAVPVRRIGTAVAGV